MPATPHRDTKAAGAITVPLQLSERAYTLFKRGLDTFAIADWLNVHGADVTEAQVYAALARALDERYEGMA